MSDEHNHRWKEIEPSITARPSQMVEKCDCGEIRTIYPADSAHQEPLIIRSPKPSDN